MPGSSLMGYALCLHVHLFLERSDLLGCEDSQSEGNEEIEGTWLLYSEHLSMLRTALCEVTAVEK